GQQGWGQSPYDPGGAGGQYQQQGAYGPHSWQPPPGGYGYGTPYQPAQTNGMAIAALICGVATFACGITFLPALILGYIAKGQIDRSGGQQQGRGMAVAGIVIGWIGVAFVMLFAVLLAIGVATDNSGGLSAS
ncbi:MAG: DUF4190 domain-containing protein, partial [Egibacteraceae bacterium]